MNSCKHDLGFSRSKSSTPRTAYRKASDDSWLSQTQKEGDKWQNPTIAQHHENLETLIQRKEELMLCLEFEEKGLFQNDSLLKGLLNFCLVIFNSGDQGESTGG